MGTWAQLSPAERQAAREQYKSLRALPPEKKQEVRQQWEYYQTPAAGEEARACDQAPAGHCSRGAARRAASVAASAATPAGRPVRAATKVG